MTRIILVRHAECVGNVTNSLTGRKDFELSENGKKMADDLAEGLKNTKIDVIYSSPSIRCVDTVRPTAKNANLKIITDKNLMEKYFGIYDGMRWDEVDKINPEIKKNKQIYHEIIGIPEQETTEELERRMKDCITEIAKENDNKTVLICSHGCAIFTFLNSIEYIENPEKREKYSQSNACNNELEYENGKFKILKINQTSHIKQREIAK